MESLVPVVDFSQVSLEKAAEDCFSKLSLQELTGKIHQAFSTVGFVYLKNHGIPQEKVNFSLAKVIRRGGWGDSATCTGDGGVKN